MFAKLLKHEIKSSGGLLGVLSLAALGIGVAGGLMMRYMVTSAGSQSNEVMNSILALMFIFVFLALAGYGLGSEIYLAVQFYKRKFTDEGYLTFTLPVRSWQIFLSSLLNMILWTAVISIVMIVAFASIFLIGLLGTEVLDQMQQMNLFNQIPESFGAYDPWYPVYAAIEFVSGIVLILTCVTLGSVLAKRHKILGAIGVYYGLSLLLSAVSTWLMGQSLDVTTAMDTQRMYLISSAIHLTVVVGGSFLSCWLMDKKLNLP